MNNKPFTVIGFHESGKLFYEHVRAADGYHAFGQLMANKPGITAETVVAVEGHVTDEDVLTFPGESVVGSETILEQPEVFGAPRAEPVFAHKPPAEHFEEVLVERAGGGPGDANYDPELLIAGSEVLNELQALRARVAFLEARENAKSIS